MITIQIAHWGPFEEEKIEEREITVEKACRYLHSLAWNTRPVTTLVCDSNEDKKQLIRTYYDMYHDEFNIRHNVNDEEQWEYQLAYPATTDVFYVENLIFRFEAGIRALDPRYARVNTHQTSFTFQWTPFCEWLALNNATDEETKSEINYLKKYVIYKHEQLNHLSYEDAQEYLEQVWTAYQAFFQDVREIPSLDKIIAVNKDFNLPWYERL